ncbi:BnaA06g11870D [Brassica napus]|uniref:BnaA06g11870D protein n=1 Tax=Brassica napus TaxID=3708 RepID=A0A078GID8_BRANA|nr:BnaA06g11870D [Brassica napus]
MIKLKTVIAQSQQDIVMHTIIFDFDADLCDHEPIGGYSRIQLGISR